MTFEGTRERRCGPRGIEQQRDELLLRAARKPQHLDIRDRPVGSFLRGSHDKVADAATLNFSCAPDYFQRFRRNSRFDSRGTLGLCSHVSKPRLISGILPDTMSGSPPYTRLLHALPKGQFLSKKAKEPRPYNRTHQTTARTTLRSPTYAIGLEFACSMLSISLVSRSGRAGRLFASEISGLS